MSSLSRRFLVRPLPLLLALTFGATAFAPAGSAFAQPSQSARTEAATRFKKGLELFREGDFQAAIVEFRRAYELAPNYNVLYNIGQVSFQLQDYPGALASLQRYLAEGGRQIPNARRAEVERDIEKLKSRVANLDIHANVADADVTIDDVAVGRTPLAKPVLVSVGKHRVAIAKQGYATGTKVVEIASQETVKVNLELAEQAPGSPPAQLPVPAPDARGNQPPPPPQNPDRPSPPPPRTRIAPIVGWVTTGALATGAVVTGVLALSASDGLKNEKGQVSTKQKIDGAAGQATAFAVTTDVLAACAIVAGGISVYLTLRNEPVESKAAFAPRKVILGVEPGGLRLNGTF